MELIAALIFSDYLNGSLVSIPAGRTIFATNTVDSIADAVALHVQQVIAIGEIGIKKAGTIIIAGLNRAGSASNLVQMLFAGYIANKRAIRDAYGRTV